MPDEPPLARRDLIASRLAQGHAVVAGVLAEEFGVSEDAIRRDLRALAEEGRCRRVYGGALPISAAMVPMSARMDASRERKEALARAAAATIRAGELVFLDSGSTNLAMAAFLPEDSEITVATNSVDIAAAVLRRQDVKLLMIGGPVDPLVGGCVDGAAVQSVMQLNIDRYFLGACAVEPKSGVGASHASDATFKRAALAVSEHCLALVMTDKFSARGSHRVASFASIETLIVEHDAPAAVLNTLVKAGVRILKAEPGLAHTE